VSRNDSDQVRKLIQAGAYLDGWDDEGRTPIFLAARSGHTESVIALVVGGAQIDLSRHTEPRTAFSAALSDSRWKTAAALLGRGASRPGVEGPYRQRYVAAQYSLSYQGDIASLQVFLDAGISPNLAESSGVTPLMGAVKGNQYEAARMLINAGADVNARASHNRTALGIAKAGRFSTLIELLEGAGARD
jgi:cytohesin